MGKLPQEDDSCPHNTIACAVLCRKERCYSTDTESGVVIPGTNFRDGLPCESLYGSEWRCLVIKKHGGEIKFFFSFTLWVSRW